MASINLNHLKRSVPQVLKGERAHSVYEDSHKYMDISLDLTYISTANNLTDTNIHSNRDLLVLKNIEDVKQALLNLLTTIPGQKLLNPMFGLNLSHYCFSPIT